MGQGTLTKKQKSTTSKYNFDFHSEFPKQKKNKRGIIIHCEMHLTFWLIDYYYRISNCLILALSFYHVDLI